MITGSGRLTLQVDSDTRWDSSQFQHISIYSIVSYPIFLFEFGLCMSGLVSQTHRFKMAATTRPPTLPKKRAATRSIWKHINTLCTFTYWNKASFECRRCKNIASFQFCSIHASGMRIEEGQERLSKRGKLYHNDKKVFFLRRYTFFDPSYTLLKSTLA